MDQIKSVLCAVNEVQIDVPVPYQRKITLTVGHEDCLSLYDIFVAIHEFYVTPLRCHKEWFREWFLRKVQYCKDHTHEPITFWMAEQMFDRLNEYEEGKFELSLSM